MGWESWDPTALEGWKGRTEDDIVEDMTCSSHYYIFGSARGSLGIPRAQDVALPAFYCATVDYITAIIATPSPLLISEAPMCSYSYSGNVFYAELCVVVMHASFQFQLLVH